LYVVCFYSRAAHRAVHLFPTRRSSDLVEPSADERRRGDPQEATRRRVRLDDGALERELELGQGRAREQIATPVFELAAQPLELSDRKSTRLNSSHVKISYAVFCLKKKK